ncbi:hypothetical protein EV667_3571 [Ancylobacter aquaticus]|uniref:Uncharacterized protein n=1 Tax=Ancylobacter aquaticus TaxID=100 RepID=A0A4R1HT09_ANCAQ|nr:hypothetical protein [Ancylobacter aquaticus]TCK23730.1 hypothetical protein EV667_3571 [Ancylobacter aquaticus]
MWDFSIATTLSLVLRTWPFVLLRLVVYAAIASGFVLGTGLGAGTGFTIGLAFAGDGPLTGALIGAVAGLCLVCGVLWWVRQYLVYLVKAGHVAAMDALLQGRALPGGRAQIAYALATVRARFLEVNLLFALDLLIRGVVRALVGLLNLLTGWIPGFRSLNAFVNGVLKVALGLVDEIILAYIIRHGEASPAAAARDGLVLYAQNAGPMLRNAIWIALFEYAAAAVLFLFLLGPAIGLAYALPGGLTGFGVVFALVAAWALKAALIEPLSIAALLQAYDIAIAGQRPDPEWTARLDGASAAFRNLADRAPRPHPGPTHAAGQPG